MTSPECGALIGNPVRYRDRRTDGVMDKVAAGGPGLLAAAEQTPPFAALVDPGDQSFIPPGDVPARILTVYKPCGDEAAWDRAPRRIGLT